MNKPKYTLGSAYCRLRNEQYFIDLPAKIKTNSKGINFHIDSAFWKHPNGYISVKDCNNNLAGVISARDIHRFTTITTKELLGLLKANWEDLNFTKIDPWFSEKNADSSMLMEVITEIYENR